VEETKRPSASYSIHLDAGRLGSLGGLPRSIAIEVLAPPAAFKLLDLQRHRQTSPSTIREPSSTTWPQLGQIAVDASRM
jgi:hypothetical protein